MRKRGLIRLKEILEQFKWNVDFSPDGRGLSTKQKIKKGRVGRLAVPSILYSCQV